MPRRRQNRRWRRGAMSHDSGTDSIKVSTIIHGTSVIAD